MVDLLQADPRDSRVDEVGGFATSVFLIGWATGGIVFGIMGDRIGRARTMVLTILVYSIFTGFSALSVGTSDFALYRFLTGLGVGGEFAVGVALLAEVMPDHARTFALGSLQAFSAIGNIAAALIYIGFGLAEQRGMFQDWRVLGHGPISPWRLMFLVGIVPALLALLIRRRLKEPERWQIMAAATELKPGVSRAAMTDLPRAPDWPAHAAAEASNRLPSASIVSTVQRRGSVKELFGNPKLRKRAFVGLALAFAGVVGLWGIGFYSYDLQQKIFTKSFQAEGMQGKELEGQVKLWKGLTSILLQVGAFFGIYAFSYFAQVLGRRLAFAFSFIAAMFSTATVFWFMETRTDLLWMVPLMGFCLLSLFGGYAIYFPELFPTRLRSTGTSFCYNVGRLVAAVGPYFIGFLTAEVFVGRAREPMRYAGVTMCLIFLLGLLALPFAPETKGQPLPD
jgi:MFS family permease